MRTFLKTALAALAAIVFPCLSWAAGEIISFNINNTTVDDAPSGLLSESALCVANKHWNVLNCPTQSGANEVSVARAKDNSGALTLLSLSGSGVGKWQYDAKTAFGEKGHAYADGPWTLTLTDVPYTTYDVVLYMGTDIGSLQWGAIRIGSDETATYYVPGAEDPSTAVSDGVTATSTWGQTTPETHGYGTDVIRIRNLTAQTLELATLKPTDDTRAGLYGFQIVNMGEVRDGGYVRTLSDNGVWEVGEAASDWGTTGTTKPAEDSMVELTVASDVTLTMNVATSLSALTVSGEGKLTFAADGEGHTLTSVATMVNADVDASEGVVSLGAVTIGAGKTLTVDEAGVVSSSAAGRGTLALNGVGVTDKTYESLLRDGGTVVVSNADVAAADGAMINGYAAQNGQFVIDNSTRGDNAVANRVALHGTWASITVKAGSKVALKLRDFGGWTAFTGEALKLTLEENVVAETEDVGNVGCFTGQLVLNNNVTVTGGPSDRHALNFWTTGTADTPNLLVKEGCTATYAGELWTNADIFIGTEQGAKLKVTAQTKGNTYTKVGAGTLDLSEATLASTGAVTLEAGTLILGTNRPRLTSVADGTTLRVSATSAEKIQGKLALGCTIPSGTTVTVDGIPATVNEDGSVSFTAEGTTATWTPQGNEAWTTGSWGEGQSAPTSGSVTIDVSARSGDVTLTLDAEVALEGVEILAGQNTGTVILALAGETQATFEGLVSEASVSLPVQMCAEGAEVDVGTKALTLTSTNTEGGVAAPKVLAAERISLGAGVVYALDNAVDTIPLTLAGGKVKTSAGLTYKGRLTLEADSEVDCTGTLTLDDNTRGDLVLNTHKLTKTGIGLLKILTVDLENGEIDVAKGTLQLGTGSTDCSVKDVTLAFASGTDFTAYGWLYAEGTLIFDCAEGANVTMDNPVRNRADDKIASLTKRGAGAVEVPQNGGTNNCSGTITVEAGTLTLKSSASITRQNLLTVGQGATLKLSGSGTQDFLNTEVHGNVEVADTAQLSLKASGENALQSLKVAEGASATLVGTDISVGVLSSGSGALAIGDGIAETEVALAGANGNYRGAISVAQRATLTYTAGENVPLGKGSIVNDGLVRMTQDSNAQIPPMSGTGDLEIQGSARMAGPLTITGTVTIADGKTLKLNRHESDFSGTPSINGPSIVFGRDAKITMAEQECTVTLPSDKSLSGSGCIEGVPTTFAAGAIVDASAGAPMVTGALTLPETGTVTVKAPEAGHGTVLTAGGVDAARFALEVPQAQKALVATDAALLLVQTPVGVEAATGAAIAQAAAQAGVTDVTQAKAVSAANPAVARDVAGAALFSNVITVAADGVATVAYDFGIAALTIREVEGVQYVVLAAKVQGAPETDYAEGTTITVERNGVPIAATEMPNDPDGVAPATGVKWFRIPYGELNGTGTFSFKVKAVSTPTTL